jgi:hypothetical protein
MLILLLICFVVAGIALDGINVWMKLRVNEALPKDQRLSWWSRDYRRINKFYEGQRPDSVLPDVSRFGGYLVLALFVATFAVSMLSRD